MTQAAQYDQCDWKWYLQYTVARCGVQGRVAAWTGIARRRCRVSMAGVVCRPHASGVAKPHATTKPLSRRTACVLAVLPSRAERKARRHWQAPGWHPK